MRNASKQTFDPLKVDKIDFSNAIADTYIDMFGNISNANSKSSLLIDNDTHTKFVKN